MSTLRFESSLFMRWALCSFGNVMFDVVFFLYWQKTYMNVEQVLFQSRIGTRNFGRDSNYFLLLPFRFSFFATMTVDF